MFVVTDHRFEERAGFVAGNRIAFLRRSYMPLIREAFQVLIVVGRTFLAAIIL